jgi:hypothetical protein
MGNIKKRQHYVWSNYLKPWTQDDKIWCKRDDKLFHTSLVNVAIENYFYKINKLNETEKKIIINCFPDKNSPWVNNVLKTYNIIGDNSDESRKDILEDFHTSIENNFGKLLDELYKKNLSFLGDNNSKNIFSRFLSYQYFRTRKMLEIPKKDLDSIPYFECLKEKFDSENVARVVGLIYAEKIANWIMLKSNIYFFESSYELITGDQPVVNVLADIDYKSHPAEKIGFYYPLTPNLAIYVTEEKFSDKTLNEKEAKFYNEKIKLFSHEQIYAKTCGILES